MDKDTLIALLEERQYEKTFEEAKRVLDAFLAAGEDASLLLLESGLTLGPDVDLLEQQGSVLAGQGDPEEALASWERVLAFDGERISANDIQAEWPERELARLQGVVSR